MFVYWRQIVRTRLTPGWNGPTSSERTRGPGGRDFSLRQLWDMKGSVDTATLQPAGLGFYGGICAWALARAHARTGDSVAISAYTRHG